MVSNLWPTRIIDEFLAGIRFITGSFWRFMIAFGVVLLVSGMAIGVGIMAGHLAIYGGSAVIVGVLGRSIARWKLRSR